MASDSDLPGPIVSLGRSLRLAYQAEPWLLLVTFVLLLGSWIPESLTALWLKLLADGLTGQGTRLVVVATTGLTISVAGAWLLRAVGERVHLTFRERATVVLEAHVARLQATIVGIEHHERPDYLDRLQVLRDQSFLLNRLYESLIGAVGNVARLAITVGLLMSIHPALAALALFALPGATFTSWRAGAQRAAQERAAPHARLARHLFDVTTEPGPAKEVRLYGAGQRLAERHRRAWQARLRPVSAARWSSALWSAGAWTLFGLGYMGAVWLVAIAFHGTPGRVLLVLAAGGNLTRDLSGALGMGDWMRWTLDAARRLAWLEDYARDQRGSGDAPVPSRIESGIEFDNVSFRYPATEAWALREVTLRLPAGSIVALVGENGAGKTTLVKLLCRFYEPSSGHIRVDGVDLRDLPASVWRSRLAGAFQDFVRYEFRARRTVGLGELALESVVPAVEAAVERAGATDVLKRLPRGLETQLGATWTDGVDLSFGQWQKLALARGFMRERPLVLLLDEPTAALDAQTEHAIFEGFAAQARSAAEDGRITVLISHRFSTVRMADLIVVVDKGRVAEQGTHDELVALGGVYADLYRIQASGYR